jgi:hypothetical protein
VVTEGERRGEERRGEESRGEERRSTRETEHKERQRGLQNEYFKERIYFLPLASFKLLDQLKEN